jgi:hemerythrin superfamily protein
MPGTTSSRSRSANRGTTSRPAQRTSSRKRDVIALIKADHATVNELFRRYQGLGARAFKSRRRVAERVIKELSMHAAVEEQILYPNARAALPNGKTLVKEAIAEHQTMKKALAELDKCPPESERFDELMREIRDEVRHHVKEEEAADGILGQLRKRVSREDLQRLATMTTAAKKTTPTRPHPKAPATPPGNMIIGTAAAIVDKARDKVGGRN